MQTKTLLQMQKMLGELEAVHIRNAHACELTFSQGWMLFDYGVLISIWLAWKFEDMPMVWFTEYHDYSRTTCKTVREWINIPTEQRRKGVESGKYGFIKL